VCTSGCMEEKLNNGLNWLNRKSVSPTIVARLFFRFIFSIRERTYEITHAEIQV
jgi:hypothetical protein